MATGWTKCGIQGKVPPARTVDGNSIWTI